MRKTLLLSCLLMGGLVAMAQNPQHLTKAEAEEATAKLLAERVEKVKQTQGADWKAGELKNGNYRMKFIYKLFGEKPADGRALYISMHGGGGTTPAANDQQWENQKRLYNLKEGMYFVPRSPTDTWNMWHQGYMDGFIDQIIENAVIYEGVNPNKVYIMGYSAGGDGTFQLAPRLADHWAAASMMAGHPNDAQILSLRNLPFAIFMGGQDAAYGRNELARKWSKDLDALHKEDPDGYIHKVTIHEDCGHWMLNRDTVAIDWLYQYTRNPIPNKVVWVQDDIARDNFYWLYAGPTGKLQGLNVTAEYDSETNTVNILRCDAPSVIIGLNDNMMDLDKPVTIKYEGNVVFKWKVSRKLQSIAEDVNAARGKDLIFPVKLKVMHGNIVTQL